MLRSQNLQDRDETQYNGCKEVLMDAEICNGYAIGGVVVDMRLT
jgi:hypothetical protein